jgi:hypothetical protein
VEDDSSDQLQGRAGGAIAGASWFFQLQSGGWQRFDPALEKAVEDAWTKDQASVQFGLHNFLLQNMQQENMQTKRKRKIKREGGPKYNAADTEVADRAGVGGRRGGSGGNSMAAELVRVEYKRGDRVRVLEDQEQVKRAFRRGCDVKWQVRWREVSPQSLPYTAVLPCTG